MLFKNSFKKKVTKKCKVKAWLGFSNAICMSNVCIPCIFNFSRLSILNAGCCVVAYDDNDDDDDIGRGLVFVFCFEKACKIIK